jgi:hypothetical protein
MLCGGAPRCRLGLGASAAQFNYRGPKTQQRARCCDTINAGAS